MKLVIDRHIPFIQGAFDDVCRVEYLSASDINSQTIEASECLVVRTRTKCNAELLADTGIKMIATATAGYEHIDMDFCDKNGIKTFIARGCNASSVAQYVGSAIAAWVETQRLNQSKLTLGIVGYGFVGKAVELLAKAMGIRVLINDPPLEYNGYNHPFVSLTEIANRCNIITFHTPLTNEGVFATHHLADEFFFRQCKRSPLIINAARGGVVCEKSMITAYRIGQISGFVVDCWEAEPDICSETLNNAFISTPHIAGYSADGKANATKMCIEAVANFFGLTPTKPQVELSPKIRYKVRNEELSHILLQNYDIIYDSDMLKAAPNSFEQLRNNYRQRREIDFL